MGAWRTHLRRRCLVLAASWAPALLCAQTAPGADPHTAPSANAQPTPPAVAAVGPLRSLHYGQALFAFYQQQHFTALTGLMADQSRQRMAGHEAEAELLRGGLLLAYGLHEQAGAIFEQLIAHSSTPLASRDRAWYFLARLRHQRDLPAAAAAALARIRAPLPAPLDDERQLLTAQVQLALGDNAAAVATLRPLAERTTGTLARYARYNLGVALARQADPQAPSVLQALGQLPAVTEEDHALRDQAQVALGFAALREGRHEAALALLGQVRLDGPWSAQALLGAGWAGLGQGDADFSLKAWTELAGREPSDPAVLEARVALPYALAERGARAQALAGYQQALADFEQEQARLAQSIAVLHSGALEAALLAANPGDELGWMRDIRSLPAVLPHPRHLTPLLASHAFQEGFKNHRDMQFLMQQLQQWQSRIAGHKDMLQHRQTVFAAKLPGVDERSRSLGLEALRQRRDQLAAELAQADSQGDGHAFASASEQNLLARRARVQALLAAHPDAPELAPYRERARLLAGRLDWELAQQQPQRQWQARKALNTLDSELASAQHRAQALQQARTEQSARFDSLALRLGQHQQRLTELLPQLQAADTAQRQALHALALEALQQQQQRLTAYAAQARLAIAQLYDHATLSQDSAAEQPPSRRPGDAADGIPPQPQEARDAARR